MTGYQLYTRLTHALTARHWRGFTVHSPMMYAFIREVVLPNKRSDLIQAIQKRYGEERVLVIDRVAELQELEKSEVVILREPFFDRKAKREFGMWYAASHVVVAHLQGLIVLFFDPKLQKQYYKIRN